MQDKIIMSVGQCVPDHYSIARLMNELGFDIEKVDYPEQALELLIKNKNQYALVLVNRKIDIDYSDGLELIKKIKSHPEIKDIPVMLVSNFPEAQEEAVKNGALYGFGKAELNKTETKEKILNALNIKTLY